MEKRGNVPESRDKRNKKEESRRKNIEQVEESQTNRKNGWHKSLTTQSPRTEGCVFGLKTLSAHYCKCKLWMQGTFHISLNFQNMENKEKVVHTSFIRQVSPEKQPIGYEEI